ncbi:MULTISPECIES: molybdopterin-dependent oxidoreductase [Citrobacter freundii complex]|uniref:molybdopterin-dependent oxidoreductase n=1 Tax=Citrobacter freundii complex TaxID=1344959 RepID=UPI0007616BA2|nr:molybdopterin-dependent oxidoreductase [Citrobacter portucalensis]MBD9984769.1 molybdopterin-dependent oxidoreductase [Citrobacter portucalensis]MBE0033649.1 molybdopterin-dependent oxidoreductase [Citrobacter portucalensis]MBE0040495.1 molybdopterin-dependent oxidoreductase [Citrobacter portucalensis]MBE0043456.1 molybdopterin-dependent oxidoreductase [Citrobacter portucalensis]MBE0075141.1 molybdopterin-dependent oxidoreductase [Citrobacter portucalensis]
MSNEPGVLNRRSFLKGLIALGTVTALPGGLLTSRCALAQPPIPFNPKTYKIYRNACPRNCYDTCSLKTWVKDDVITFVEGAPESTFTHGTPCVKGLSYPRRVYSPDRIKYPMVQDVRGSGNWRRISWDEAMQRIATKMLEIKKKDGSMLGLALTKYSGKFGVLNYAVEGMMSSLGYTTRFAGTPCWPAGIDAQNYDMGDMWCNDPEDMVKAKYIIIWGANPAWCSMHTMKYIYQAREKGAKVVVIDPLLTQTAAKADLYLRVRPGSDGALALGMARHLVDKGLVDQDFVNNYSHGYAEFEEYLRNNVTVEWASEICGLSADVIRQLAEEFTAVNPATVWIGYGMQRHVNGGANVRAIDAFVAMTGNIGIEGGGARYGHLHTWGFNYNAMLQKPPVGSIGMPEAAGTTSEFGSAGEVAQYSDRSLNINQTAKGILEANEPPVRMLWVACKNPFAQDFDRSKMEKAFEKLEMVVCADQFFNETVQHADIVLPVTTAFEEWNVDASYWHYWLSINQPAIKPMYEAKCDLEIAVLLSRTINKLEPGSCTFPQEFDHKRWLDQEFNDGMAKMFGISSWDDLLEGPKKAILPSSAAWYDRKFKTPSGKFEFKSELCEKNGHTALPEYKPEAKSTLPFHLFTPHVQFGIHSQFINLDWMQVFYPEPFVYMHPVSAGKRGIAENDLVKVFNTTGEVELRAKVTANVPEDFLVMYEAWFPKRKYNVQNVVADTPADMGLMKTGAPGAAIHSQFADIILIDKGAAA